MIFNSRHQCSFPKFAHITPDTWKVSSTANLFYVLNPSVLGGPADEIS